MAFEFFRKQTAVLNIPVERISPNPFQPRTDFSAEDLSDLADSIRQSGIIQPVSVRRTENGFELIAGERRLRAGILAGLKTVPALVYEVSEKESALWAILENVKRKDLSFIEEARAIEKLAELSALSREELSAKLAMAPSTLSNKLRVLKLPEEVLDVITAANLTEHHAREILRLREQASQTAASLYIAKHNLNVPETEKYITSLLTEKKEKKRPIYLIKDVKLFVNTFEHAVDLMKKSGISAKATVEENETELTYKVTIPKNCAFRSTAQDSSTEAVSAYSAFAPTVI